MEEFEYDRNEIILLFIQRNEKPCHDHYSFMEKALECGMGEFEYNRNENESEIVLLFVQGNEKPCHNHSSFMERALEYGMREFEYDRNEWKWINYPKIWKREIKSLFGNSF